MFALVALAAVNGSAASLTAVNTTFANPSLFTVLDAAYGAGNYERVSDDLDILWTSDDLIGATVIGKYASANQRLGICLLCDGSDNVLMGPNITANGALSVELLDEPFVFSGSTFRWFDAASGDPYVTTVYSDPLLNPLSVDQMVTFAINERPGVFVLAFEDRPKGIRFIPSDRDFNDFIVEVRFAFEPTNPIPPDDDIPEAPEPATIALFGGALLALGLAKRGRRKQA